MKTVRNNYLKYSALTLLTLLVLIQLFTTTQIVAGEKDSATEERQDKTEQTEQTETIANTLGEENNSSNKSSELSTFALNGLEDFPLWGEYTNNILVSGEELCPEEFVRLSVGSTTTYLLNNQVVNTDNTTYIQENDVLKITNIGMYENKAINVTWTFGKISQLASIILSRNESGAYMVLTLNRLPGTELIRGTVPVKTQYTYQDGTPLPTNLKLQLSNYHSRNLLFALDKNDLVAVFTNKVGASRWQVVEEAGLYRFDRLDTENVATAMNFIISSMMENMTLGFGAVTSATNSSYILYTQSGPIFDNNSPAPKIEGIRNDNRFISSYSITQEIGTITNGKFSMEIEHDGNFHKNVIITSIVDNENKDLTEMVTVDGSTGTTIVTISAENMKKLRSNTLHIKVDVTIDKEYKDLSDYLKGDDLSLPLTVSTNYASEPVTAKANTWARPWGDPIPQEVVVNTSTEALDPTVFVANLNNKLDGDTPFVVGFAENKLFDVLGETFVGIVVESKISGIQNIITVPVKVIEPRKVVFHVRQVIYDPSDDLVIPSEGYIKLVNDSVTYNVIVPSGKESESPDFEQLTLSLDTILDQSTTIRSIIPSYYQYVGYQVTDNLPTTHHSSSMTEGVYQFDEAINGKWVTVYLKPSMPPGKSPSLYSWSYKKNKLGKIRVE